MPAQNTGISCREFVRAFYSWYLASASKDQERDGGVALKYHVGLFSPAIVRGLLGNNEAQEKAGSDLVSLDGDPFVGADGLAGSYIVEKTTIKKGRCWAEVHGVWNGKEDQNPDVIPELTIRDRRWRFVNFYYPSPSNPKGSDLLGGLKALREGGKQPEAGKDQKP
jgi:hypothetical protein